MKTRREFLKTLLGGTVVLATAVTVPGMVITAARKPETHMIKVSEAVGPTQSWATVTTSPEEKADWITVKP